MQPEIKPVFNAPPVLSVQVMYFASCGPVSVFGSVFFTVKTVWDVTTKQSAQILNRVPCEVMFVISLRVYNEGFNHFE